MGTHIGFAWTASARSDVGMVRKVNEDACLARSEEGLWVVADGMGGHAAGDLASGLIVEQLAEVDLTQALSEVVTDIEQRLLHVNEHLRELASSRNINTIGSTVAVLILGHRHGICLWAGDSRVYRVRAGQIEQLSQDHAFVEDLVERGILSREDAAGHPQSNLVTRAVGAQDGLKLDMEIFELAHDDTFILCSDGLDKEVTDQEIVSTVASEAAHRLGDELVERALSRGARDNVTVVTVRVTDPGRPDSDPDAEQSATAQLRALSQEDDGGADSIGERTDFGRLARSRPKEVLFDDEDSTVRRPRGDDHSS